ncbi:hypothetical protein WJX73_009589 [Symbiochloris irregularis]|uniref:Uncharacterized protein n=1 Tax=Symbiochloris irregularis TaxID=706552 RepID=A0AAW1Q3T0_9CHLO
MRQTEVSLAEAAKSIASAGRKLGKLADQAAYKRSELYNLSFDLETEAAAAMQQHLESQEPQGSVEGDHSLLHIVRDSAHIAADTSKRPAAKFSFDAAFVVYKPGREAVWVGELKTTLNGDDVATAHKKMLELQEYIDGAGAELLQEIQLFQRQAAQLRFLQGYPIKLFAAGARIMPDAMHKMDELACTKLVSGEGCFTVHEPSAQSGPE